MGVARIIRLEHKNQAEAEPQHRTAKPEVESLAVGGNSLDVDPVLCCRKLDELLEKRMLTENVMQRNNLQRAVNQRPGRPIEVQPNQFLAGLLSFGSRIKLLPDVGERVAFFLRAFGCSSVSGHASR